MPIFDACIDVGIRLIHTRHEGAAVYMAEANSQLTGEVGIAMITAAPGFASGLGPLYMARMAENLAFDIAMAMRIAASGRPGPVHVALAFDLLNADIAEVSLPSQQDFAAEVTRPGDDALRSLIDALAAAERPAILTGPSQNPTRTRGLLEKLADALDAPVIPMESPRGLKDPCLGDFASVLSKADVIVNLGKNIDFSTDFGQPPAMNANCKFLVVDPETDVLERARRAFGSRLTLGHRADADTTAQALAEMGKGGTRRTAWRTEMAAAIAARHVEPAAAGDGPMRPAVLCAAVQRLLDAAADPILIVDGGEFGQWSQAFLSAKTRIINGPSGSIGGALCYAVAAKIARPDATVAVLMGEGGVGFHFAEFDGLAAPSGSGH